MNEQTCCERCGRAPAICVCADTQPLDTRLRVLVLQHPREQDVELGSAKLASAMLGKCQLVVGLSWASLAKALGEPKTDATRWAVVFPDRSAEADAAPGFSLGDKKGLAVRPRRIQGLVVLDGSWSQARSLWWRNPWLLKLNVLSLRPREPSIYGSLRPEPRRDYVSTLEAIGYALSALGEEPVVETTLRRTFRRLVQRARDARISSRAAAKTGGRAARLKQRRRARAGRGGHSSKPSKPK